ncbi:hypothetical protein [Eubacterium ruminantium]|uniref:hypothetical protein n=1 Tax=Eubacterium ruminantium TaxID=42322 RepID=UPI003BFA6F28
MKPVVDQLELHPGYSQEAATEYCKKNDIVPMAWSPLGRGRENATIGNISHRLRVIRIIKKEND